MCAEIRGHSVGARSLLSTTWVPEVKLRLGGHRLSRLSGLSGFSNPASTAASPFTYLTRLYVSLLILTVFIFHLSFLGCSWGGIITRLHVYSNNRLHFFSAQMRKETSQVLAGHHQVARCELQPTDHCRLLTLWGGNHLEQCIPPTPPPRLEMESRASHVLGKCFIPSSSF